MKRSAAQWGIEPFRKFARFSGRAPRAEYWWFYLLYVLASVPASFIDRTTGTVYASGALLLVFLLPLLAVTVRRFHDGERSGWWLLLPVVAGSVVGVGYGVAIDRSGSAYPGFTGIPQLMIMIGGLVAVGALLIQLIWLIGRGTDGPNRYGPDVLDTSDDVAEVFR